MADSGCTPQMALNGCFGIGQPCQVNLTNGGCIPPLQCFASFTDAGVLTYTCCDLSTGVPMCG
jgi:hypothetical protein